MKHLVKGNRAKKLGRHSESRKALLAQLSVGLIKSGSIETTLAKAKFVRPYFEKLITKAQKNDLATRRYMMSLLGKTEAIDKLINEVAPLFKDRAGGYTRIQRTHVRSGDAAQMAKISLVENMNAKKDQAKSVDKKSTKAKKEDKAEVKEDKPKRSTKSKVKEEKAAETASA